MKNFIFTIIICIGHFCGFSQQKSFVLKVETDELNTILDGFLKKTTEKFSNVQDVHLRLDYKLSKIKQKGYLEANVDSVFYRADTIVARIHIGKQYQWDDVRILNANGQFLKNNLTNFGLKRGRWSNWVDLAEFQGKILDDLGDRGYPFTQLRLTEISFLDNKISGVWEIHQNQYVFWDSLILKGNAKISPKFLCRYLGVIPNKPYRESTVKLISERINNLSFVKEIKPSEVEFENGKARVYSYLDRQASNQFDGILGIQSGKESERIQLTGEVKLLLENTFSDGDKINFKWRRYEEKSQYMSLGLIYPYLFSSNLGLEFQLGIQKQDSSYLKSDLNFGLRFFQKGANYFKFFYVLNSSSLISTKNLKNATALPDFADTKSILMGIAYHFENLDYAFNPHKGWRINANIGTGIHKIKKNSSIPEELYEGIKYSGNMVNTDWEIEFNLPVKKELSFRLRNIGGLMEAQDLFENDLFKLGGISSLRGFNEDSFRASFYSVMTGEVRFIPEKNSSIYLFLDRGYYQNNLPNKSEDFPWGLGFGLSFGTKTGIFTLNYAVGQQKNQKLDFQTAKIHFGFINHF